MRSKNLGCKKNSPSAMSASNEGQKVSVWLGMWDRLETWTRACVKCALETLPCLVSTKSCKSFVFKGYVLYNYSLFKT